MKIIWQNIPVQNLFTKRNAVMRNLDNKKIIQYYSANTKIQVVQEAQFDGVVYYRTASARDKNLNWAFEATAFGLPNEPAPSAPIYTPRSTSGNGTTFPLPAAKKQKPSQKSELPKEGAVAKPKKKSFLARLFRR